MVNTQTYFSSGSVKLIDKKMYTRRDNCNNAQQENPDKKAVKLNIVLLVDGEEKCDKCGKTVKGVRRCCSDQRVIPRTYENNDQCGNRPTQFTPPCGGAIKSCPSGVARCPLAGVRFKQPQGCQTISNEGCQTDSRMSSSQTRVTTCTPASASLPPRQPSSNCVQKSMGLKSNTKSALCQTPAHYYQQGNEMPASRTKICDGSATQSRVESAQNLSTCQSVQSTASVKVLQTQTTSTTALAKQSTTICVQNSKPQLATVCPVASAPAVAPKCPSIQATAVAPKCPSMQSTVCQSATATVAPSKCPSVRPSMASAKASKCASLQPTACPSSASVKASKCPSQQSTVCQSEVLVMSSLCASVQQTACPSLVNQRASNNAQNITEVASSRQVVPKEPVEPEPAPPMEEPSPVMNLEEKVEESSEVNLNTVESKAGLTSFLQQEEPDASIGIVNSFVEEISRGDSKVEVEKPAEPVPREKSSREDVAPPEVQKEKLESVPTKTKSDDGFDRPRSAKGATEPLPERQIQSETVVATVERVRNHIDFALIRSESRMKLEQSLSQIMQPGLTGLKEFMSSRHLVDKKDGGESRATILDSDQPHLNKFIDYFIDCDGLRYLGILEQIELDFEDRCKAALLTAKRNTQAEAEFLRAKLAAIAEFQPEYKQITLKEFNFPELLTTQIKGLAIDYKPKMMAIKRIHEYGLDMEKYWLNELANGKRLAKEEIYEIGTQMLAELMGQLFSLLVKSCEFLVQVNIDIKTYKDKYVPQNLIHLFSEFRRLLVDEVSAVGETCGGVMIKIPQLTDDDIIEIMTKLYSQVNFVDICICKALRAVQPLILLYDFHRR